MQGLATARTWVGTLALSAVGRRRGCQQHARARLARRQVWECTQLVAQGGGRAAGLQPIAGPPEWGDPGKLPRCHFMVGGGPSQAGRCCNATCSAQQLPVVLGWAEGRLAQGERARDPHTPMLLQRRAAGGQAEAVG